MVTKLLTGPHKLQASTPGSVVYCISNVEKKPFLAWLKQTFSCVHCDGSALCTWTASLSLLSAPVITQLTPSPVRNRKKNTNESKLFLFSKLKERLEDALATWLVKDTKNLHLSSNILWLANCDSLFQQLRQSFGFSCAESNKHVNLKPSNTAAFHFWHLTFWNGKWFFKTGWGNGHIKVFEKMPTKDLKKKAGLQVVSSKNIGLNIGAIFQKCRANIGKMVK